MRERASVITVVGIAITLVMLTVIAFQVLQIASTVREIRDILRPIAPIYSGKITKPGENTMAWSLTYNTSTSSFSADEKGGASELQIHQDFLNKTVSSFKVLDAGENEYDTTTATLKLDRNGDQVFTAADDASVEIRLVDDKFQFTYIEKGSTKTLSTCTDSGQGRCLGSGLPSGFFGDLIDIDHDASMGGGDAVGVTWAF